MKKARDSFRAWQNSHIGYNSGERLSDIILHAGTQNQASLRETLKFALKDPGFIDDIVRHFYPTTANLSEAILRKKERDICDILCAAWCHIVGISVSLELRAEIYALTHKSMLGMRRRQTESV